MRIALGRPDPLDARRSRDGIGVYATGLARALRGCGEAIDAVSWWYPRGAARGGARFPLPYALSTAAALVLGRTPGASELARSADVFHATDYRIPRLPRVPVVATLHDAVHLRHPEWVRRHSPPRAWIARASAAWAQRVVCVSNAAAAEVVSAFRVPEQRVRVIYPGVDEPFFADRAGDPEPLPAALAGVEPAYFLFVGTLQPRKNLARVIAAHRTLPRAIRAAHRLLVAGGYGWGCDEDRRALRAHCEAGHAWWPGEVPHALMPAVYRRALALVIPSLHEGFGLPVIEAFASGTPVIASTAGALPEVAADAALLVDPLDVSELGAAMRRVAEGGAGVSARVDAGLARARRFTWPRAAQETLAVYRELL